MDVVIKVTARTPPPNQAKTKGVLVRGRVIQVQEQRFRLALDDGPAYLLTLAHDARADLEHLLRTGQRVVVEYEGEPGLSSGVAHTLRPA